MIWSNIHSILLIIKVNTYNLNEWMIKWQSVHQTLYQLRIIKSILFFFILILSTILYRKMLSRHIYLIKTININSLTPQSNLFINISVSFFFLFFPSLSLFFSLFLLYPSISIIFVSVECSPACPLYFCSYSFLCRLVQQND